jgi:hypothetical protein
MTADPDRYAIVRLPVGPAPPDAIAVGGLAEVMEYIPQSLARAQRERQLADAEKRHVDRLKTIESRSDSVAERERQIAERERALQADRVQRFCDSIDDLAARLAAHEQAMVADALARLPDRDHPQGLSRAQQATQDDLLAPAVHEPSHDFDKEQLEAMLASERGADDAAGDLPNELQPPAAPLSEGTRPCASVVGRTCRKAREDR